MKAGWTQRWFAPLLVALATAPACSSTPGPGLLPPGDVLHPGDHEIELTHGGRSRSYVVHVPANGGTPPVLLAFHGGGGSATQFKEGSEFDRHADEHRYVVVYPNGTGGLGLHVWNAGGCCGAAVDENVDDVGFVRRVIDDLAGRLEIDRDRVYATGHSNGSMMAHRLAVEAPDLVAAIAAYAGAPYFDLVDFPPDRPLPVLHIHSVDDPRALYDGGLGPPFPLTGIRTLHEAVEPTVHRWAEHNGCAPQPDVGEPVEGAPGSLGEGHTATLLTWAPCGVGVEVRLLRLTGAGHGWPGQVPGPARERVVGPATDVIDIEDEIWNFVSVFSRPGN